MACARYKECPNKQNNDKPIKINLTPKKANKSKRSNNPTHINGHASNFLSKAPPIPPTSLQPTTNKATHRTQRNQCIPP